MHAFVASYTVALPIATLLRLNNRLIAQWSISGATGFTTGLPVTLFDNTENSLLGTLGNGANNYLLDTPRYLPGSLKINTNGRPTFNTLLFPEEIPGQLGNAKRRDFYSSGIKNFDLTLQKNLRAEAFNAFNHAQFYRQPQ